jgi:hypothetical protein
VGDRCAWRGSEDEVDEAKLGEVVMFSRFMD